MAESTNSVTPPPNLIALKNDVKDYDPYFGNLVSKPSFSGFYYPALQFDNSIGLSFVNATAPGMIHPGVDPTIDGITSTTDKNILACGINDYLTNTTEILFFPKTYPLPAIPVVDQITVNATIFDMEMDFASTPKGVIYAVDQSGNPIVSNVLKIDLNTGVTSTIVSNLPFVAFGLTINSQGNVYVFGRRASDLKYFIYAFSQTGALIKKWTCNLTALPSFPSGFASCIQNIGNNDFLIGMTAIGNPNMTYFTKVNLLTSNSSATIISTDIRNDMMVKDMTINRL